VFAAGALVTVGYEEQLIEAFAGGLSRASPQSGTSIYVRFTVEP
jgi:hypothetical protein